MNYKKYLFTLAVAVLLIAKSGCSDTNNDNPCQSEAVIQLEVNICLNIEHEHLASEHQTLIENKIKSELSSITQLMPIDDLQIRIVENINLVISIIGIGGYNPNEHEIIIAINQDFANLENSINTELIPQIAHEIHHAKRRRSVGYGSTLFEAVITEGLADHFSIEVTGIDPPPWSLALTGQELQDWLDTASDSWNDASYTHSDWFVGTNPDIPAWTGYALGYYLVDQYLETHPERKASDLHNEPASSFQP